MDDGLKPSETESRRRQFSLGMSFVATAYLAIGLLGATPSTDRQFAFAYFAAVVVSCATTIAATKGAAFRGLVAGLAIWLALVFVMVFRDEESSPIATDIIAFLFGFSACVGSALGAAERGHRFVAWLAIISMGLFIALCATSSWGSREYIY